MDKKLLYEKLYKIDKFEADFFDLDDPTLDLIDTIYYNLKKQIDSSTEDMYESISNRMDILLEALDYRYGLVNQIISRIPELSKIKERAQALSIEPKDNQSTKEVIDELKSAEYLNAQIDYFKKNIVVLKTALNEIITSISNYDFLENPYVNQSDKEGIKLSLDSIKTILENPKYQEAFPSKTAIDFLVDYEKLSKKDTAINRINREYKDPISKIWQDELTSSINEKGEFSMLVSMIRGKTSQDIEYQVNNMINRPSQHSCTLITNDFVGTYLNGIANIGLIYPTDSKIITCGYNDLYSNVFGDGIKNKEKSSQIATPKALIENGINKAVAKGEDLYNSNSYNEVLVDSSTKPCGIVLLINKDRELMKDDIIQARILSQKLGLPITEINTVNCEKQIEQSGIMR